jgi:hypothetical protein
MNLAEAKRAGQLAKAREDLSEVLAGVEEEAEHDDGAEFAIHLYRYENGSRSNVGWDEAFDVPKDTAEAVLRAALTVIDSAIVALGVTPE